MRASSGRNRTLLGAGLALLTASFAACDAGPPSGAEPGAAGQANSSADKAAASVAERAVAPSQAVKSRRTQPTQHGFRVVPTRAGDSAGKASLRAAYIESVNADSDASHSARAAGADRFQFENAAQALRAELGEDGLRVAGTGESAASASFRLTHYGCAGREGDRLPAARPSTSRDRAARVSYARPRVVEWYQNGRLGLEQGFDLKEAPACRTSRSAPAEQPVVLAMELSHDASLHPMLMHGRDGSEWLELRDDQNRVALRYSDLYASDADGKELPAHLSLDGKLLSLRIDDRGARYPLRVDPLIWSQVNNLYKSADPDAGDRFGSAIAIAGDHAVVGAPNDDQVAATDAGAVYVYQLSSQGTWTQQAKILATVPMFNGLIGTSVAIADAGGGDKRIVIGGGGVAAWFIGHGTKWTAEAEFSSTPSFGTAVAVSGDRVVVGASAETAMDGAVVVYEPDLALSPPWGEKAVIGGAIGSAEQLGKSVAISGSTLAVGAPSSDLGAMDAGRIEIWERDPGTATWLRTGALQGSDRAAGDRLGASVAVGKRTVIAGAPGKNTATGAAYVFTTEFGVWSQEAKLVSATGATGEAFGQSVAIAGDLAVAGIPMRTVATLTEAGALEVFARTGTTWALKNQVTARTPLATDRLGDSVAIDATGGHILAGAPLNDTTAADSGGYYDIVQAKQSGDACAANLECASGFCIDAVCCESACGGGSDVDCQACANTRTGMADGLCRPANTAFVCRPAAGGCDQAETCDGTALVCPTDAFMNAGATCRAAAGACDTAELCPGGSPTCPADAVLPSSAICRAAAGDCDAVERCDGQTKGCPIDVMKPALSLCRLPTSDCDAIELCDGVNMACPTDAKSADNSLCSGGSCQAGMCRLEADVAVSIGGFPSSGSGQGLPYSIFVSNAGRSAATAVNLEITLPGGATALSYAGAGFSCTTQDVKVTCTRGSLGPSEIGQLSLLISPAGQSETLNVSAKISSGVFDPNLTNNTASFEQSVLSTRVSGTGLGCAAAPGAVGGGGALAFLGSALMLLATMMRRRRAS